MGTGQTGAVHQRPVVEETSRRVPELGKRYWGQHLWARGYFCASVGAVDEQTAKQDIENPGWDEDDQGFKITAPTEPCAGCEPETLQAASAATRLSVGRGFYRL